MALSPATTGVQGVQTILAWQQQSYTASTHVCSVWSPSIEHGKANPRNLNRTASTATYCNLGVQHETSMQAGLCIGCAQPAQPPSVHVPRHQHNAPNSNSRAARDGSRSIAQDVHERRAVIIQDQSPRMQTVPHNKVTCRYATQCMVNP